MPLASKNILVTGGTGFIGKSLIPELLAQGSGTIFLLTRTPHKTPFDPQDRLQPIDALEALDGKKIDIIINLAGEPIAQRWTASAKTEMLHSRLMTTQILVNYMASAPHKPELFISGSAIGYYGTSDDCVFDEDSVPLSDNEMFSQTLCKAWEAEAQKAEQYAQQTVYLRTGVVLEKDGGMLGKLLLPFTCGVGGAIGSGKQPLSWIDRDDMIKLILFIIGHPHIRGAVNATAPHSVDNATFSQTLARTLKRPCLFPMPGFVLHMLFGQMAEEMMLQGQHVFPRKLLDFGFTFDYPTLSESLQKILR